MFSANKLFPERALPNLLVQRALGLRELDECVATAGVLRPQLLELAQETAHRLDHTVPLDVGVVQELVECKADNNDGNDLRP